MGPYRIFRLLMMKKQLEQKTIGELCMLQTNESRVHLYKLLQKQYVQLQEVPSTADRQVARTFFLWSVDQSRARAAMLHAIYAAALRLLTRLMYDAEHASALGGATETSPGALGIGAVGITGVGVAGTVGGSGGATAGEVSESSDEQQGVLTSLKKTNTRLSVALLRIDDNFLLLRDL